MEINRCSKAAASLQRLGGKAAKWKGKREKMQDFTARSTSPRDKEGAERKRVSFHYRDEQMDRVYVARHSPPPQCASTQPRAKIECQ